MLVGERGEEEVVRKVVVFAVRTLGDNGGGMALLNFLIGLLVGLR